MNLMFIVFLKISYIQRSFRSAKLGGRYRDSPITPGPQTCTISFLHYQYSHQIHLLQYMNLHYVFISQSPQLTLVFTVGVVHFMHLDKCIMTSIHHYSVMQSSFTAIKNSLCSAQSSFQPSQCLETTDVFTVSILLSFPECHIVGIIQHVDFSDCLLSLSNMYLRFLYVFSQAGSSFLFSAE